MKNYLILNLIILLSSAAFCQCTVTSTDGYTVNVNIVARTVVVSSTNCPNGYNYNLGYDYNVYFTGPNIPSALYTLQVLINCNGQINGGYTMPLAGGTGSSFTTTNPYIPNNGAAYLYITNPSCVLANVTNLQCNSQQLIIQGPGINYQVINCPPAVSLPVDFIEFKGKAEETGNLLTWNTASEHKNSHYTLKHSRDGYNWTELAIIEGKGTTAELSEYSYLHKKPESGVNYYALWQTDLDGTTKELGITGVENSSHEDHFLLSPNPSAAGFITVKIGSEKDDKLGYIITDELGRTLESGEMTQFINFGNRHVFEERIAVPDLQKCCFITFYRNGEILRTEKIIVL